MESTDVFDSGLTSASGSSLLPVSGAVFGYVYFPIYIVRMSKLRSKVRARPG